MHKFRHTEKSPCPVCKGYVSLPKGQGIRCWGVSYPDDNNDLVIWCTREEYANGLSYTEKMSGYLHTKRRCKCGKKH